MARKKIPNMPSSGAAENMMEKIEYQKSWRYPRR
jgi:hypothetical protein